MTDYKIDLLDTRTLSILSNGIYAKLAELYREDTAGFSRRDNASRTVSIEQNYLMLARINVHQELSVLKQYSLTPIETKLAKAKVATAKVEVEQAEANLDVALDALHEARKVIVIPHAAA